MYQRSEKRRKSVQLANKKWREEALKDPVKAARLREIQNRATKKHAEKQKLKNRADQLEQTKIALLHFEQENNLTL